MEKVGASDTELVAACRRGDRAAFGELIERHQRAVGAIAYAHVRERALADDIAQDAFVAAWSQLDHGSGPSDGPRDPARVGAWLCGIARNLARQAARRNAKSTALSDALPDVAATPFEALGDAEVEALVADALGGVPDAYREVLVLFYYEQQSARDVAAALGIAEAAVHKRLSRGREHLAAGVERAVAHTLERPRTRKALAAAVLAALPVALVPKISHARASTTKGTSMWKMAVLAAVATAALVFGVDVTRRALAAPDDSARTRERRPSATAPAPARPDRGAMRAEPAPALPAAEHVVDPRSAPRARGNVPRADGVLDCTIVAQHLVTIAFAQPAPAGFDRDAMARHATPLLVKFCTEQNPTQAKLRCMMAAESPWDASMCGAEGPPHPRPAVLAPLPPGTDISCAAAAHQMTAIPAAELAAREDVPDVDVMVAGLKAAARSIEDTCTTSAWPEAVRSCLVAATTSQQLAACR
ncbi:MAG TPA: sigma-70 family RNA polymerase sigma factor [Kofleriaceae bacterium]|nr:sigma-70 family RNA polymerase sigma factor [Kofleriaceae bacterium]